MHPCPIGTHGRADGILGQTTEPDACTVTCVDDSGLYCVEAGLLAENAECPLAHYCPNTVTKTPCPAGTHGRADGILGQTTVAGACAGTCAAGFSARNVNTGVLWEKFMGCEICPLSHFCPDATTKTPCPVGTAGRADGILGQTTVAGACPRTCATVPGLVPGTSSACEAFPEEQVEECCWSGGCVSDGVSRFGRVGCGAGQYEVDRRSVCPGAHDNYMCSKCTDCPVGRFKAPGCSYSGEEACLDCPQFFVSSKISSTCIEGCRAQLDCEEGKVFDDNNCVVLNLDYLIAKQLVDATDLAKAIGRNTDTGECQLLVKLDT
jgi:hypothetical protein